MNFYGGTLSDYSTDLFTARAEAFINSTPTSQPFFLYLAPFAPHFGYVPHPSDTDSFAGIAPWRPPSYNEINVSDKPLWVRQLPLINSSRSSSGDLVRQRQIETLQAVDRSIGRLINILNQTGRLNNTVIIYTSDNGLTWGEHRILNEKICVYEECGRVPLWVHVPGIQARSEGKLVENIDFAPTIAELAGITVPNFVNGMSFVGLLSNPTMPWRNEILLEGWGQYRGQTNSRGFSAVRTPQYVYAVYNNSNQEFYDLAVDPYQLTNRVNNISYNTTITQLKNALNILKTA